MRLDVYLSRVGLAASRTEAQGFISSAAVKVGDTVVTKPSFDVEGKEDKITVDRSGKMYVSRGGIKLAAALSAFSVEVGGKRCLDVGASSGGFTDCLLQNGAEHVIAVDSGSGQMAQSLRCDPRVTTVENYNARYIRRADLSYAPELAVMDVSFISATYIIPSLSECLADGADFILLVKPQFEVGRSAVGKGGIVRDDKARRAALERILNCAREHGLTDLGVVESPIRGGDGNLEYLAHFKKITGCFEK